MCDHCHIRPKYPYVESFFAWDVEVVVADRCAMRFCVPLRSYNYCGKRCGLKAASVGSQTVMVVLMCKVGFA